MTQEGQIPDRCRRSVFRGITNATRIFFLGLLFACGLPSCSPDGVPVGEAEYSAKIVGTWQGTVGDRNEVISLPTDDLYPRSDAGGSLATLLARVSQARFAERG